MDRDTLNLFAEESAVRLSRIADRLDLLEKNLPVDMEVVHDIFRDTHSLKSAANLLALKPVEKIAHKLEDILERIRSGSEEPDEALIDILGRGYERIEQLLKNIQVIKLVDVDRDIAAIERLLLVRGAAGRGAETDKKTR